MNKKKVFILALAVCLIAILSMSTLAWFNSTADVKNDFMFDDTDNDGKPDFKVEIFETDKDGNPTYEGNEYTHVAPNAVLPKDPTVQNVGDYGMYTRVIVTLDNADTWMDISTKYGIGTDPLCILEEMVDIHQNWVRFDAPKPVGDTLVYVYYHNGIVEKGVKTAPVFSKVTIPAQIQQDDLDLSENPDVDKQAVFSITVKADAIQSDNIIADGATITGNEAYTAFSNANWAAGLDYPQPTQPNP